MSPLRGPRSASPTLTPRARSPSLGNFLPSLFLPQFAQEVGAKPDGAHLISIMNACSVPGLLLLGWLTDKAPLRLVIAGSCLGAALSTAFLWGFAESNAALVVFACVFGLCVRCPTCS